MDAQRSELYNSLYFFDFIFTFDPWYEINVPKRMSSKFLANGIVGG